MPRVVLFLLFRIILILQKPYSMKNRTYLTKKMIYTYLTFDSDARFLMLLTILIITHL